MTFTEEAQQEKTKSKKYKPSVPKNYCFITYQVSTDNEKTWHQIVINSGQNLYIK